MRKYILSLAVAAILAPIFTAPAKNPVIYTSYTPDPAPFVCNDTVFLFVDHDEDDALYFKMKDWQLYSTTDMVNWTYRGTPISTETFKWAKQGDNAWASQAVERDGKWYWYICAEDTASGLHGIGVAVAPHPWGPYEDALGKPLVPGAWGYIDPSVFIDDDGQAYLFWGNNGLWYARLGRDMVSVEGEVTAVDGLADPACFGPNVMKMDWSVGERRLKTGYEEGPWVVKRNGLYYLIYAAGGVPEHMAYSTATDIRGPWTYRGRIMDEAENSFTIHGGSIETGGRHFMFYHNGTGPNGGGFHRSTAIEEFKWEGDSLPFMPFTKEGVRTPLRNFDPYQLVSGPTMSEGYGLKTDRLAGPDHYVTKVDNGDWMKLRSVDFGAATPSGVSATVRNAPEGAVIEFHADYLGRKPIAVIEVPAGIDGDTLITGRMTGEEVKGVHDLHIIFRGGDGNLLELKSWQFDR